MGGASIDLSVAARKWISFCVIRESSLLTFIWIFRFHKPLRSDRLSTDPALVVRLNRANWSLIPHWLYIDKKNKQPVSWIFSLNSWIGLQWRSPYPQADSREIKLSLWPGDLYQQRDWTADPARAIQTLQEYRYDAAAYSDREEPLVRSFRAMLPVR